MKSDQDFDVFICHASEDKDPLVRPLAAALTAAGLRVWYDETSLSLGSNLRRSIDVGLSKARHGLVVISQAFFAKEWPQWELDGLHQRHLSEGNVLLPIWHEVSADSVRRVSPSLANLVAVSTSEGLGVVIEKVLGTVRPAGEMGRQTGVLKDLVGSGNRGRPLDYRFTIQ